MTQGDSGSISGGRRSCDLLVVGAGACGLWLGYKAAKAGLSVVVADGGAAAPSASASPLGALMPHMPDRWNDKKQFQFEALAALSDEIAALESETGLSCGYRRVGRIVPLTRADQRSLAEERGLAATRRWTHPREAFAWRVVGAPPGPGWPEASAMSAGGVHETLSARLHPERLLAALRAGIVGRHNGAIAEDATVVSIDGDRCRLSSGQTISFGAAVIAAGVGSFALMAPLVGIAAPSLGRPVKGQAALLAVNPPVGAPIVFSDGVYVVPHDDGTVAIGSTSEEAFEDAFSTDFRLDRLIERAGALCPAVRDAPVLKRWAGLRPRAAGRDPMIGPLPDHPRILAMTGGFKITLGIAHRLADALLADIQQLGAAEVPAGFRVEAHLAAARR